MKIIARYVLQQFLAVLGVALFAFLGLYLVIDFFEKFDNLLSKNVQALDSCQYFLYKIPLILTQGIPMAVLLATLVCIGILNRNRELIALKVAGVSIVSYAGPILLVTVVLAAAQFVGAEFLARQMNHQAEAIWQQKVEQRFAPIAWSQENVWYHGKDVIYQIRLYDQRSQNLEKVSIFYLSDDFKLLRRLDTKRLHWQENHWIAENGFLIQFEGSGSSIEIFSERELDLQETPEDFKALKALPQELNWLELYRYSSKLRQEGYNSWQYQVDLHLRLAIPVTAIILALLGLGLALRQGLRGNIAVGVGLGIGVAGVYLTVLQVGSSLGNAGIVPPFVGVWSGNLLFAALGIYLLATAPQ
jgi:lipopolysaccharide export system permease protein